MIVGRRPFTGSNLAAIFHSITHDTPESPASVDPFISRVLSDLIMKCLEKPADNRFQSGRQLVEALHALESDAPGPVADAQAPEKTSRRPVLPIVLGLLLIAGLSAGGYFYLSNPILLKRSCTGV